MKWRADVCVDLSTSEVTEVFNETETPDDHWAMLVSDHDYDKATTTNCIWVLVEYDDGEGE